MRSGADLAAAAANTGPFDVEQSLRERYHPIVLALRRCPKPAVSAVSGSAAGAGMSLALACDIVLAGESASFLQAFTRIGLVPDCGSTWLLPRLVGEVRARAMVMLADKIGARDALQLGAWCGRCLPTSGCCPRRGLARSGWRKCPRGPTI